MIYYRKTLFGHGPKLTAVQVSVPPTSFLMGPSPPHPLRHHNQTKFWQILQRKLIRLVFKTLRWDGCWDGITVTNNIYINQMLEINIGGEGGIRTLGTIASTPDFESGTFDHSATSPNQQTIIASDI